MLFRYVVAERMGTILLSALVAHTAWHWMLDRGAVLGQYHVQWPAIDGSFAVAAMRLLMLALIATGIAWMLSAGMRRLAGPVAVSEVAE
jgi:hypothetical protein